MPVSTPMVRKDRPSTPKVQGTALSPKAGRCSSQSHRGLNTMVAAPKAEMAMPEARPSLWGIHFCTQERQLA